MALQDQHLHISSASICRSTGRFMMTLSTWVHLCLHGCLVTSLLLTDTWAHYRTLSLSGRMLTRLNAQTSWTRETRQGPSAANKVCSCTLLKNKRKKGNWGESQAENTKIECFSFFCLWLSLSHCGGNGSQNTNNEILSKLSYLNGEWKLLFSYDTRQFSQ